MHNHNSEEYAEEDDGLLEKTPPSLGSDDRDGDDDTYT